jgi:hypothetical protein
LLSRSDNLGLQTGIGFDERDQERCQQHQVLAPAYPMGPPNPVWTTFSTCTMYLLGFYQNCRNLIMLREPRTKAA